MKDVHQLTTESVSQPTIKHLVITNRLRAADLDPRRIMRDRLKWFQWKPALLKNIDWIGDDVD